MNEEKGLRKIKTTVEFPGEQVIEEDSSDDQSVVSPLPTGVGGCMKPPDPSRSPTKRSISSQKQIGIEMRMANAGQQDCGYIEVSPSEPGADFLTGPAPLITRTDFMHMIQEGVRMALSAKARNNDVTVIKTRTSAPIIGNESVNSQQSNQVEGKKKSMRYILHQYKPKNFQQIRTIHGITNEDFISSLCDSDLLGGWTESSGKSGSLFWYSSDRRYIMKSISAQETHVMNHMCSSYLRYIGSHPHSLLCKFFGMFKITTYVAAPSVIRGGQRASRIRSNVVQVTRFVIMNNVFEALDTPALHRPVAQSSTDPSPPAIEKFDLKGTTEDRYVRPISGKEVLKDINFNNRWITLPQHLAECLIEVITEDCQFLHHHGIMDYSLILGIKESNNPETRARLFASNIDLVGSLHSSHHESKPTFKKKFESKMKEMSSAVHKLLTPNSSKSLDVIVQPKESSSLPSRMPSITEENMKNVVTDSASEPPKGSITPIATTTANDRSIFTSFHGGVAGLSEPRTGTVIYYLGIIDILQEYTIKKKAAHCIKRFSIGCCHEIDTVAPLRYKNRFHKYMVSKIQTGHDIVET